MRLALAFTVAVALTSPALAQDDAQAPPPDAAPEVAPARRFPALSDPNLDRRKALFDLGFNALVDGNLPLAERAFAEAQMLPGDPAQNAVAASFVERVRELRARRRAQLEAELRATAHAGADGGHTARTALLGATTILGLGLYGWALPTVLGISPSESTKSFVGVYMLTASASFVVPYLLLSNAPVSAGESNLAFYGGTRGIWVGVLTTALIAGDVSPDRRSRAWTGGLLFGSVAGLVGGYQVAKHTELSAGEVRTIAAVGDLGLAMGFGTGLLLRLDGGPRPCPDETGNCFPDFQADTHARHMAAAGLMGMTLGLGGGALLARHRQNTWGDGEVLRGTTALGVWAALGVAAAANMDFSLTNRSLIATLMVGGGAGLVAGDGLTRHTDFGVGQSLLIDMSMLSGGLLGAGTAYLLTNSDSGRPYLAASALGASIGFGLAYWGFHDTHEGRLARRLSGLSRADVAVLPLIGDHGERGLTLAGRL
jgi:hypothetical protein